MKWSLLKERIRQDIWRARRKMIGLKPIPSYNIYRCAEDCPFPVFEKCLVDENYHALGEAPDEVLQQAWLSIYFEYLQLIDSGTTNDRMRHLGRIHVLSGKVEMVKRVCQSILDTQMDLLLPVLHDLGYTFVKHIDDLRRVVALIKKDEMELKILIANLPKEEGTKPTRDHFDQVLFRISEFLHTIIHKDKITVSEYCGLVNSYEKHVRASNKR